MKEKMGKMGRAKRANEIWLRPARRRMRMRYSVTGVKVNVRTYEGKGEKTARNKMEEIKGKVMKSTEAHISFSISFNNGPLRVFRPGIQNIYIYLPLSILEACIDCRELSWQQNEY
jgi:hypothetical protein